MEFFKDICCEGDKRDGSVAGGKCGVKGEPLRMYLHSAEGDELVVKGMHRNEELSRKEAMGLWGQQERRHGV